MEAPVITTPLGMPIKAVATIPLFAGFNAVVDTTGDDPVIKLVDTCLNDSETVCTTLLDAVNTALQMKGFTTQL